MESVLRGGLGPPRIRVTVVCHNLDAAVIEQRLTARSGATGGLPDGVRVLELHDGIRSPAGPFNHGLDRASARFVSIMGSDDTVDPGTYAAWLAIADAHHSSAVVAAVRTTMTGRVPTPAVRPGHTRDLDPIRDGLAYRTAPLGLVRRSEVERLGLRLTDGLPSGEDQEFSARLWFGGGRIDYAAGAGDYVVHDDQADRVTAAPYDLETRFRFATLLVSGEWFPRQDRRGTRDQAPAGARRPDGDCTGWVGGMGAGPAAYGQGHRRHHRGGRPRRPRLPLPGGAQDRRRAA